MEYIIILLAFFVGAFEITYAMKNVDNEDKKWRTIFIIMGMFTIFLGIAAFVLLINKYQTL